MEESLASALNIQDYSALEVYATKACAAENSDRSYRNRNIYIVECHLKAGISELERPFIARQWLR
jgi:hypothetical protein